MDTVYESFYNYLSNLASSATVAISAQNIKDKMSETVTAFLNNDLTQTLYDYIVVIGVAVLLLYTLIDLMDKSSHENISVDIVFYEFVKFLFFYFLMKNGLQVMRGFNAIADWSSELIIGAVNEELVKNASFAVAAKNVDVDGTDFFGILAALFTGFGNGVSVIEAILFAFISNLLVFLVAYQRVVKLGYQVILAPFALADVCGNGFSVSAKHFLINLFKIFMQEPIIIVSMIFLPYAYNSYSEAGKIELTLFGTITALIACASLVLGSEKNAADIL